MQNNLILISLLLFISIVYKLLFKKESKHQYKIKQGDKILNKLNSFEFPGQKINYLRKIDPFVFEELLLSAFEKKGFRIQRNKKYTGDGGIDGTIFDTNENKYLIQAKRYSNYINLAHLKAFEKLLEKNNCNGFFVHTGKTGKNSRTFSQKNKVIIISGTKLIDLLK